MRKKVLYMVIRWIVRIGYDNSTQLSSKVEY